MAISEEFGNIADRKVDAGTSFSSSEDASRAMRESLGGRADAAAAIASEFAGRIASVAEEVGNRDAASGIRARRSQDDLMAELTAYVQGTGTRDEALCAFAGLDRSHAECFLAVAGARLGASERSAFQGEFDARFKGPGPVARTVAGATGDTLLGSDDSVVGDAWDAARSLERAAKAVERFGAGKGAAAAVMDGVVNQGDDDGIIAQGAAAARTARSLYTAGRTAKIALGKRSKRQADTAALSAKRKSMEIARAAREGRVAREMGIAARLKLAAQTAASGLASGLGSIGGIIAAALASMGGLGAGGLAAIMVLVVLLGGGSSAATSPQALGMTEVEARVYTFFSQKGLGDIQIAAIMGNMYAESRACPSNLQHVAGEDNACPNEDILALGRSASGKAAGLWQWDMGRRFRLAEFARDTERNWYDVEVQLEFFWSHDIWQRNWGSGENTKAKFYATDNLETATRIFLRGWEAAGVERLQERIDYANGYLAKIGVLHGGQELSEATRRQRDVVKACLTTPTAGEGWCAAWVSGVFENAGVGAVYGNACDMYGAWCKSSNRADLKVGMIVAVPSHSHTVAGRRYGHVGVYIGDGKLMDNIGPIRTIELDRWLAYYGDTSTPMWGWANGIDLTR